MTTKTKHLCPMCEEGELIFKTISEEYIYKKQKYTVKGIETTECPICDDEITLPEQIKHNEALIIEAKRKLEGFLSSNEIKGLRKKLNLTQEQAAKIFGGGVNAFSKYERNEVIQSSVMDKLMRVALESSNCFDILCKNSDIEHSSDYISKSTYTKESKEFARKVALSFDENDLTEQDSVTLDALQVASWFVPSINRDDGDTLSHLKLQKLIYYYQSWHVSIFNKPLFDEPIQAWCHGPVVPSIYYQYEKYKNEAIPDSLNSSKDDFKVKPTDNQRSLMELILNHYGELSASHLSDLTHKEQPWLNARGNLGTKERSQEVISMSSIINYYGDLLKHVLALY